MADFSVSVSTRSSRSNGWKTTSSKSSLNTISSDLPSYQVEENSLGELINYRRNVKWPQKVKIQRRCDTPEARDQSTSRICSYKGRRYADLNVNTPSEYERAQKSAQYICLDHSAESTVYENEKRDIPVAPVNKASEGKKVSPSYPNTIEERKSELRRRDSSEDRKGSTGNSPSTISVVSTMTIDDDINHHYAGVCSKRRVEKKLKEGDFFIYYEKPSGQAIPLTIDLKLAYMSYTGKIYHFAVQRVEVNGEKYFLVAQDDQENTRTFPSILQLVKHYHTYADVDPKTGRMETFAVPM